MIPLCKVEMGKAEQRAAVRVMRSGWLAMGPETEKFEAAFAEYVGAKYAVATSSGTGALHIACLALGLRPGDEVIVPGLTYVATADAPRYVGATPVFADVCSEKNLCVSPASIADRITARTKAVIVMHYAGYPCNMEAIAALAKRHDLAVIEDAAHAHGAEYKGRKVGGLGDVGCFSFYANKNMTTGEGGIVITNNPRLYARMRLFRANGLSSSSWVRHRSAVNSYNVVCMGYNYAFDDVRAAIGREQLKRLDANNEKRHRVVALYRQLLVGVNGLSVPCFDGLCSLSAAHIFPILLDNPDKRSRFREFLQWRGIQTSVHYDPPVHLTGSYLGHLSKTPHLPITEMVARREVTLPLYPSMTNKAVRRIVETVKEALR